jgi:endoglucanase
MLKGLAIAGASLLGAKRVSAASTAASTAVPTPDTPAILLNQLGFLPASRKRAAVRAAAVQGDDFRIVPIGGGPAVFQGTLAAAASDAASGDSLRVADFSAMRTLGTFRLEAGGATSDPFAIQPDSYADALRVTMRSYYGQRCGCAVNLGNGYRHPPCHLKGAYHTTSGRSGPVANHGGWHDAGDYGRYVVNGGISTGTLLWAWEMYEDALRMLPLDIPESGGKLPDYLAEVRWNLDWMLSLQDDDGGVWHKQTSEHFCGFVMPQDDTLVSYVIGTGTPPYKSTCATADLASVAAIAARCYRAYDSANADRCLAAAPGTGPWRIRT